MDFPLLEKHPWLTGGAILGGALVLYLYWRSGSTSSNASAQGVLYQPAGTDPAIVAANTQMQIAQLSAGVASGNTAAVAGAQHEQLAAQLQVALGGLQVQALQSQNDAAVNLAFVQAQLGGSEFHDSTTAQIAKYQMDTSIQVQGMNNQTAIAVTQSNNGAAMDIAHTQAASLAFGETTAAGSHLADLATAEHLATITGGTEVALNAQNTNRDISVTETNANRDISITDLNDEAAKNINYYKGISEQVLNAQNVGGAEAIATTQADRDKAIAQTLADASVANTNATVGGAVAITNAQTGAAVTIANAQAGLYKQYIDAASLDATQKNAIIGDVVNGVNAGVFNKGGAGGADQVSILASLFGQPSVGVAAQAGVASAAASNSPASILAGIAGIFKSIPTAAFGG